MSEYTIDGITVRGASDEYEASLYVSKAGAGVREIEIDHARGEYIERGVRPVKFDRIRRITGYLVGTLDRFNDAKRAEVGDRVKHGVPR